MSPLEQFALGAQALWLTLKQLRSVRLWTPWLLLGLLQAGALVAIVDFAHPLLAWALAPLVRAIAGEPALHYPDLYRKLPLLYGRADLALGATAGAFAAGWSTWLFGARWRRHHPAPATGLAEAGPHALTLVLAQLPFPVLVLALTYVLDRGLAGQGGMVRRAGYLLALGGAVGLQAAFLYVPALVVLERRGLWVTFAALPRTWGRGFWAALLLGAVAVGVLLPFDQLGQRSDLLVDRGNPELVGWLMALQLLVGLGVSFLLAGSATLVYLGAVSDAPEGSA
jgi:hypothetical protein